MRQTLSRWTVYVCVCVCVCVYIYIYIYIVLRILHYWEVNVGLTTYVRHRATSRKFAGSIPDGVIGIFYWHPSGPSVPPPPGSTPKEMPPSNIFFCVCKGGRCLGLTTLPPSRADCLVILEPQPPGTLGACLGPYMHCATFILTAYPLPCS
jgi:hypothetical protein